jgi:hypothetical protein
MGIDPESLFNEGAEYANNLVSEGLVEFPKRKPEDRSLEAMNYKEAYGPDGFRYERLP